VEPRRRKPIQAITSFSKRQLFRLCLHALRRFSARIAMRELCSKCEKRILPATARFLKSPSNASASAQRMPLFV